MSHPEKIIKEFADTWCWKAKLGKANIYAIHPEIVDDIKDFLLQSHLSYLLQSKKRLEGEIHWSDLEEMPSERLVGFNSALTQQIAVLEQEIKEVEKMI